MSAARELRTEPLAVDPARFLDALGIRGKRAHGYLMVACPVHDDRTPSCSVRVGKDATLQWRCHGCGEGGDALSFLMALRGYAFRDALEELAELTGRTDLRPGARPSGVARRPARAPLPAPPPAPTLPRAEFAALGDALLELCPLRAQRDVVDYLDGRRLYADAEARGFAALPREREIPALLDALQAQIRLPSVRDALILAGLATADRGPLDWIGHRLLIPWRDSAGQLVTLQRRLVRKAHGDEPSYVFPRARPTTVPFGAEWYGAITGDAPDAEVIICESAIDALARAKLARDDRRVVVVLAAPSCTGWTSIDWQPYVTGRDVVIAFDADVSGDVGADKLADAISDCAASLTRERAVGAKDIAGVLE